MQWGEATGANFSVWAEPGGGGSWTVGGAPGQSSSFMIRTTGAAQILAFDGRNAIYSQGKGIQLLAQKGTLLRGGNGAGGKEGGGGGGGGYWGGGGGGSGVDGAGGGGGSSYFNSTSAQAIADQILGASVPAPTLEYVNESSVVFSWTLRWDDTLWGRARSYDVEVSYGPDSEDFIKIAAVDSDESSSQSERFTTDKYTATQLQPQTTYSFRVVPVFPNGRGAPSNPLILTTLTLARDYWEVGVYSTTSTESIVSYRIVYTTYIYSYTHTNPPNTPTYPHTHTITPNNQITK